jgi:hypothetical protein
MPGLFSREKAVPLSTKLLSALALLLWAPLAAAQNNLGELLDAGAKQLSPEEFREEVVQRVMVGRTAAGGDIEVMYTNRGGLQGRGTHPLYTGTPFAEIGGEWKIGDSGTICTSMRIGPVTLPPRCQFWFKYGDQYFLSDYDSDRSARVLRRTLKQ